MGPIDEIKKMQGEGKSDQEIATALKQKGIPAKKISDLISQAKIKDAVVSKTNEQPESPKEEKAQPPLDTQAPTEPEMPELPSPETQQPAPTAQSPTTAPPTPPQPTDQETEYTTQTHGEYSGMEPSMLTQEQQYYPEQQIAQDYTAYPQDTSYPSDTYAYDAYSQYQPYQEAISSDIITEISEQVVADKLSNIQDRLEKAIDFRTVAEAKITSLNERLRRIEQIIDKLQLSILQKMGDYVSDVSDVKHEIAETQESFKALLPKLRETHGEKHHRKKPSHHAKKHHKKKVP